MMNLGLKVRFLIIFLLFIKVTVAQTEKKVTLKEADSLFLKNNYYLLASSLNIDMAKAQVLQARLFPNMVLSADFNVYDPDNNKYFNVGSSGQKTMQIEQLILIGGKRKSEIELAKTNVTTAEIEFLQLTRELKYKLHSSLYTIGQQEFLLSRYNYQLNMLDTLLHAYQIQADKGNIPLKEIVRLKGAYLRLSNDRADVLKAYFESQQTAQSLLHINNPITFDFIDSDIEKYVKDIALEDIINLSQNNNPELLLLKQDKALAEQYYQFQKKISLPDVTLFASYDQRGGAFNHQINSGISVPLPLFNRNQGNINAARISIKQTEYNITIKENEIKTSIQSNYQLYKQTVLEFHKSKIMYDKNFKITMKGITENFQKRNVSIIEFMDFFESYNEVMTELTRIKTQLVISAEQLNLLTGKDIF
ncbi:MAG: TolC family protein [Bacteroidia bacterium]|nr:TolC family protein [Bacteroidia bacterium]